MKPVNNDEEFSYDKELQRFEALMTHAVNVSDKSGGLDTDTIGIEGTKIYTRLILSAITMNSILPNNCVNCSPLWDFASFAVLARSFIESTHRYLYLTEPGITIEESEFRRKLYFYHLNCEKFKLYSESKKEDVLTEFKEKLPIAKAELMATKIYVTLDKDVQKRVRSGNTEMHISDAEISKQNGLITEHYGFYYRILSNHAHGSPFATTSQSNSRGRGIKNEVESFYLALVLKLISKYLSKAVLVQIRLLSLEDVCKKAKDHAELVFSAEEI